MVAFKALALSAGVGMTELAVWLFGIDIGVGVCVCP